MNDEQVRRYGRQILLDAVGGRGQRALLAAAVRVELGRGADGRAAQVALLYLAGAGVGTLILAEDIESPERHVTEEDIGMLFDKQDLGARRLEVVARKIADLNPDVRVAAEGDGPSLVLPEAPEGLGLGSAEGVAGGGDAARATWRGSAAATRVIADILSASRTSRP